MNPQLKILKNTITKIYSNWGIVFPVTIFLVISKFFLFYLMMGVYSEFIPITILSVWITAIMFYNIKKKWIPATIYFILSFLMFCDVTYCSFFNKYLSITLLGNISMLSDIQGNIIAVLRPVNFYMLVDALFIIGALLYKHLKKETFTYRRRISIFKRLIPLLIAFFIFILSGISPVCQSISKQEFFTYHVSDIITGIFGIESKPHLTAFKDYYEHEKKGEFFGIGKDKNLVVIQIESFQNFLINRKYNGKEITPFLNSLIKTDTVYFDNYYQQVSTGNTSDAEYTSNNSLMGSIEAFTYQIYEHNYFRGLPWLLRERGYYTAVLHGFENRAFWNRDDVYNSLGFERYYGGLIGDTTRGGGDFRMTEWLGWGLSDSEFYPQAVEYIKKFKEPFYSFIITLSNHHPYEMPEKYNFIKLKNQDKDTLAGRYLESAAYTDYSLKILFDEFKKAGLYENCVFALYGDHMGLPGDEETDKVMKRLLKHDYSWDDKMNIPLLIHVPKADSQFTKTVHNVGGQMDFLPTISYILGLEHIDTLYLGHNLFNYENGIVAEHAYMPYGSFFTKDLYLEMPKSGVFKNAKAIDLKTRKQIPIDGLRKYYNHSIEISDTSVYVLKKDLLRKIYEDGKSREDVLSEK
ncbi:MAG: LTA synthase family protein [Eubacteriales bacterium]